MRLRLEDLPVDMRQQAVAQIAVPKYRWDDVAPLAKIEEWAGSEKDFQAAVEKLLRARGWMYFHMPGAAAIGNPRGWPDLIAFGPDKRLLLIELKTARGKLTDLQVQQFTRLAVKGNTVHVCRSVEHVERLLDGGSHR